jgi:hypothetical protein
MVSSLCSAWAFQRHAPFFFLMQGRRKARIWIDFRAHLTQSSVMTVGFGASRRGAQAPVFRTRADNGQ